MLAASEVDHGSFHVRPPGPLFGLVYNLLVGVMVQVYLINDPDFPAVELNRQNGVNGRVITRINPEVNRRLRVKGAGPDVGAIAKLWEDEGLRGYFFGGHGAVKFIRRQDGPQAVDFRVILPAGVKMSVGPGGQRKGSAPPGVGRREKFIDQAGVPAVVVFEGANEQDHSSSPRRSPDCCQ